jgi:hypothetical protein
MSNKFFLDCEFDGFGGDLISLSMVSESSESLYIVFKDTATDLWVRENVIPILWDIPSPFPGCVIDLPKKLGPNGSIPDVLDVPYIIGFFLNGNCTGVPYIIADWPDDIKYLCQQVITGPGTMAAIPRMQFDVVRVDSWPNDIPNAVQHNAYWDARALKRKLTGY